MYWTTKRFTGGIKVCHLQSGTSNGGNLCLIGDTKHAEAMLQQTCLQGINTKYKRFSRLDGMDNLVAAIGLANTCDALICRNFNNSPCSTRLYTHAPTQWRLERHHHWSDTNICYFHCYYLPTKGVLATNSNVTHTHIRLLLTSLELHQAP